MSQKYAIRFDSAGQDVKDWLKSQGGHFATQEGGSENPHVHVLLYSEKSLAALRKDIQRKFGNLGNGGYSITLVRDVSAYEQYICKGEAVEKLPDVFSYDGMYDEEWIRSKHDAYYEVSRAAKRKTTVLEEVEQTLRNEHVDWSDRFKICKVYIKELTKRKRCISNYAVKSAVNLLQCTLCPDESAVDALCFEILRQ